MSELSRLISGNHFNTSTSTDSYFLTVYETFHIAVKFAIFRLKIMHFLVKII